jgi:hypothetical protein
MSTVFFSLVGFLVGGVVGFTFGTVQNIALRRNEKRRNAVGRTSGWSYIPGSMSRVAALLIVLVLIQLLLPSLFEGGFQWIVSAGVVIGYGATAFRRKRTA